VKTKLIYLPVVALPYVEYWHNILYLNDTFMSQMRALQSQCNYTSYLTTYFQFPPPQDPFPVLPDPYMAADQRCNIFDHIFTALASLNPCFDIYHITQTCPSPHSPLGVLNPDDYYPASATVYFNRTDVQAALHAPVGTNWALCTTRNVFGLGNDSSTALDASPPPAINGVLARVIEKTNNAIIGSGDLDMLLPRNGTLFAIQNMTWNGARGLREYPSKPLYEPHHPVLHSGSSAGAGVQGVWGRERGLTFYAARGAGHELPGQAPGVGYRMLEVLLGRVEDFGSAEGFTTLERNSTGPGIIYGESLE
jgi:carboxypeptidase D